MRAGGRRARGQNAILDAGIAAALAFVLLASYVAASEVAGREQGAVLAADQELQVAQLTAGFVQANYAAFVSAHGAGARCGGIQSGPVVTYPLDQPMPVQKAGAGGNPGSASPQQQECQTLSASGLSRAGIPASNAYRQKYSLSTMRYATASGATMLQAFVTVAGGTQLPDALASVMARRLGAGGGYIPSVLAQGSLGGKVRAPSGSYDGMDPTPWGAAMTPGRPMVYLNFLLQGGDDDDLARDAQPLDGDRTRMDGTLYAARRDASTGAPVDVALNGQPPAAGSAAAAAAAGGGRAPTGSIMGARQIDAQVLTAGSSVRTPYATDAAQGAAEAAAGRTANDGTLFAGRTILVNANLDVTSGYRLATAGPLHVAGSAASQAADDAASPDGASAPAAGGRGASTSPVARGMSWDAYQGSGMQMFYNAALARNFLGTYAGTGAPGGVVGFEADGGTRTPVVWDPVQTQYFVAPAGSSNVEGDVANGGSLLASVDVAAARDVSAARDVLAGCNLYVAGTPFRDAGGTLRSPGQTAACAEASAANTYASGNVAAGRDVTAGTYLVATGKAVLGASCGAEPDGSIGLASVSELLVYCIGGKWQHPNGGYRDVVLEQCGITGTYSHTNTDLRGEFVTQYQEVDAVNETWVETTVTDPQGNATPILTSFFYFPNPGVGKGRNGNGAGNGNRGGATVGNAADSGAYPLPPGWTTTVTNYVAGQSMCVVVWR